VVFKREKEVSRSLEFDGMWIAEQPSDDDIKGHWDKLVISTDSFPDKYWDKFVKKKVTRKIKSMLIIGFLHLILYCPFPLSEFRRLYAAWSL